MDLERMLNVEILIQICESYFSSKLGIYCLTVCRLRLNVEELCVQGVLSRCCIDYYTSYEVQRRVRHACKLLSVAKGREMALNVIVDIGALSCPPESAFWQLKPYLRHLEDLYEESPVPWFDISIYTRPLSSSCTSPWIF